MSRAFRAVILAALAALCVAVAPAAAQGATIVVTPNQVETFGYGTGTGHTTTGNSPWTAVAVRSSDGNLGRAVGQSNPAPGLNGWVKQWSDGSALTATEGIDTDSDLRVRFAYGTTGKAVGTYASTWRFTGSWGTAGPTNSPLDVPLKAYVQPWNQCTDGLDNDGDSLRDWKKGAGGSTANADTDCLDMNDTTEGGGALTPPATPSNVSCTWKNGAVDVTWTDNANNESEQYVHTQTTSGGLGQDIAVGANTTSKTVTTNITNGVQFDAWVTATNSAGSGSSVQTSFCRGMPLAAPSGLDAAAVDTDTVSVTWGDVTGETGYTLQRDTSSSFTSPVNTTLAAGTTSYVDNSVSGDGSRTYYYRVKPTRTAQATDVVSNVDTVIPPPPDNEVSPPAVSALSLTVNSNSASTASWNEPTNGTYQFEVQIDTSSAFTSPTSVTKAAGVTTHQFTGLAPSQAYWVRVRVLCSTNCVNSPWNVDGPKTATTQANPTPPAAPSGLTATATGSSTINLAWNDNSSNETTFELQRDLTSAFSSPTTISKAAGSTSHTDTALTASTQYFYRVRAVNAAGNSAYTAVANATTQASGGGLPARWDPAANTTWLWQIGTRRTALNDVDIAAYDLDWQLQTAADTATIHANGKRAICYFNAGAYQPGQPDEAQWTQAMKGNGVQGWPGEFWTDTRRSDVRAIMAARIQACKDKGFDAIEPDNLDGYANNPGFPMTVADARDYVQFLGATAHQKGLAIFLKNMTDDGNPAALAQYVDGAVNEECQAFTECDVYANANWVGAGKPVLQTEYEGATTDAAWKTSAACTSANAAGRMAARSNLDLDGTLWLRCWAQNSSVVNVGGTTTAGP